MKNKGMFHDLVVWQKGMKLAKEIYQITRDMPDSEKFGLTSQMRRASVSIPSNIAEGNARRTILDYIRFLVIARGSLAELETQLILASELKMLSDTDALFELLREVRRILQGLIDSLNEKQKSSY